MERYVPQTPWWHISANRKRQIERKMEIGPNQSDLRPKQNILAIPKNKGREGNDRLYWLFTIYTVKPVGSRSEQNSGLVNFIP